MTHIVKITTQPNSRYLLSPLLTACLRVFIIKSVGGYVSALLYSLGNSLEGKWLAHRPWRLWKVSVRDCNGGALKFYSPELWWEELGRCVSTLCEHLCVYVCTWYGALLRSWGCCWQGKPTASRSCPRSLSSGSQKAPIALLAAIFTTGLWVSVFFDPWIKNFWGKYISSYTSGPKMRSSF